MSLHLSRQAVAPFVRSSPLARTFATSIVACKSGNEVSRSPPQRYRLDRVWQQVPRQPKKWNLLQGLRIRITGVITLFRSNRDLEAWRAMPKAAFYAVKSGREPGIYGTWAECEAQVKGFTGAKYKKFGTRAEAEDFVAGTNGSSPASSTSYKPFDKKGGDDFMLPSATSTLTLATLSSLPPNLAAIARKGYSFTAAPHHLIVYTDGSSLNNGKAGARAGLGVYYGYGGEAADNGISERVPGNLQTNNRGELLSVVRALEDCPYPDLPLEIRTDSQYTIKAMTGWLPKWMKNGFKDVKNVDMIKHLLVLLRRRSASNKVVFKYVAGHTGEIGNEAADAHARRGALADPLPDRDDWLNPDDVDVSEVPETSEVVVEVDESWLLSADDLAELEKDFM